MPNYDYNCKNCGHQEEVFQKISDDPLKKCPKCSKESFERGIGGGSAIFHFKGKGFYLTDYKNTDTSSPPPKNCGCGDKHSCS